MKPETSLIKYTCIFDPIESEKQISIYKDKPEKSFLYKSYRLHFVKCFDLQVSPEMSVLGKNFYFSASPAETDINVLLYVWQQKSMCAIFVFPSYVSLFGFSSGIGLAVLWWLVVGAGLL